MDILKPNISEEEAKDLVKRLYGLEVLSIKRLYSYDDQNFHIMVDFTAADYPVYYTLSYDKVSEDHQNPHAIPISKTGYTLKVTNTKKSAVAGHFDKMHEFMSHCSEKGLCTPTPLKNLNGATWSLERVRFLNEDENIVGPKLSGIHLLLYVPGSPISSIDCTKEVIFQWGLLLAQFHNAVEDFSSKHLPKSIFWNLENIPKIKSYMDVLLEDEKELVNTVLSKYSTEIETNLPQLTKGPIHGDFNHDNVLVQESVQGSGKVVFTVEGILDFEDVHEGTYVWDVGVMMAYALLTCKDADALIGIGYALAGYLKVRSLNKLEQSLIKTCIECRLCQSLVLCAYSYSQDSNNTYLLQTVKQGGWEKLKHITNMKNECIMQKWKEIETLCQ